MVANKLLTARAFERMAEKLGPCELERGRIVEMSPGGIPHSRCSITIAFLLERWARAGKRGRVFGNEAGLITRRDPDTVRGLDVAYYSYSRLPRTRTLAGYFEVPPSLAVEVVGSPANWKKLLEKAGEYLLMGVDRVWLVDVNARSVCILKPDAEPEMIGETGSISDAKVLPGFKCRVREFFE